MNLPPDQAVMVKALAGNILLCCWTRRYTLTVPLATQVYKWALVNLMLEITLASLCRGWGWGGSRNTPSHSMLKELG